jgi:hypothetical protein
MVSRSQAHCALWTLAIATVLDPRKFVSLCADQQSWKTAWMPGAMAQCLSQRTPLFQVLHSVLIL